MSSIRTSAPKEVVYCLAAVLSLLLPILGLADNPAEEAAIVTLAINEVGQNRAEIVVDPILSQAAQIKADDMLARDYVSHVDPDGCGPNFLVRSQGYVLPYYYSTAKAANNLESIYWEENSGAADADRAWASWLASSGHRMHVLAETSTGGVNTFYAAQTRVGVGVASNATDNIFVFISAPPSGTDAVDPSGSGSGGSGDKKRPSLVYSKPNAKARPRRRMVHKGTAEDPSGIESVELRIKGFNWNVADHNPATGKWKVKTRLKGSEYRKYRTGKAMVIQVKAEDTAGNVAKTKRRLRR